ncbi:MAG: DUF6385 domain-containing protein [Bacilli bacterium]
MSVGKQPGAQGMRILLPSCQTGHKTMRSTMQHRRTSSPHLQASKFQHPVSMKSECRTLKSEFRPLKSECRTLLVKKVLRPIVVKRIERPVDVDSVKDPISVRKIKKPITVSRIREPVKIFPLNQTADRVTVFGSNSTVPIRTDAQGRLVIAGEIHVSPVQFTEVVFTDTVSTDEFRALPSQNVSLQTNLSYALVNRSANTILIHLEISPNDTDYIVDTESTVERFSMKVITPLRFLKFNRISFRSLEAGQSATLDVYYQAQSG